jgi:hypothetical protein
MDWALSVVWREMLSLVVVLAASIISLLAFYAPSIMLISILYT